MSNDPEGDVEAPADDTAETDEESADDAESQGFEYGDFVRVEYTARTAEDNHLVDTTDGELAAEEGIDDDEREFGPRTIVLGEGHIFDPVEEALVGTEVGDSGTATVSPEAGFGEYDDDEVRTVSAEKIPEDDRYPGNQVTIDGEQGFVETIIGGRARVDFNHPLAGDTLEYDWEVVGTVDDREERAQELLQTFLDIDLDVHFETDVVEEEQLVEDDEETAADADDEPTYETVEVEQEALYIDATMELTMNQQWMMGKQQIGQQLIDLLDIDRIVVQEVIEGGGLPGMMGGMGGMGGGGGGGDLEAALEDADIDADELAEEIE
jgi:FKBP-type peptidyl-prolyl cis-trans isomerase SlyD